ncbi:MAG: efflux RND transporter periplasmic adaptor subunit [Xanthobacteraceae bacterium]|nr:efflux RND transporter periplasmic adaptor subunit [Xanthobacteraceae bacterium]
MIIAILVLIIACAIFWLVFFKLRLLRLTPGWGIIFGFFVLHLLLVFVIGLRFMTPNSSNATVVQHTIQLVPRLPEPTLVTAVLVEEGVPVKKGQPLFQFDRRPYEYKVTQIEAQLAEAKQNVQVLKVDVEAATYKATRASVQLAYDKYQQRTFDKLARDGVAREEDIEKWATTVNAAQAVHDEALVELERARLKYGSQIGGVNTTVASLEAQLQQAQYYLDNTTLVAPADGRIINLQVRAGMVSGTFRVGGIAAFIADADRYLLATYFQENLKYVKPGQPVEVALDLYPGQIFAGKVDSIWRGNGMGQYLPSDDLPKFHQPDPRLGQSQYAVKIILDDPDQSKFPIGAQGAAAIYTTGEYGAWAALRKISIRAHSWFNWLYPINM